MATIESAPQICDNCPFAGTRVSVHDGQLSDRVIEPEGSILYADYEECGVSFGKIDGQEAWADNPGASMRINACDGPVEGSDSVPRRWPLGVLGFTKEVVITKCGAIAQEELGMVIDQHIARCRKSENGITS